MPTKSFSALFARWKEADALARAAEEHLLSALGQSIDRGETLPSLAEWQEARRLRARADALLDQAIEQMRKGDARRRGTGMDGNASDETR
jgi:exonuclease VII small subunit